MKEWLYQEFLMQSYPFIDPRYIRAKLTQMLTHIRIYTTTFRLVEIEWEQEYKRLYDVILNESVLYQIIQEIHFFAIKVTDEIHSKQHNKTMNISEKIVQLIETNYWNTHWGLEDVAAALDLSPSYVSRLFSKEENRSFRQALTNIRLNKAKKLLIETECSIGEISSLVGFEYPQYFSRKFKEIVGMTPKQYRGLAPAALK